MKKARILSLILIITLIILPVASFAQPTEEEFVYTALGDSIAYGTGAEDNYGYTDMLAEHFEKTHKDIQYYNEASDGLTSEDLLKSLSDKETISKIQSSDVITISIGGNDLLQPLKAFGASLTNHELAIILSGEDWTDDMKTKFEDEIDVNILLSFIFNFKSIICKIRTINPTAEIYVINMYNPFEPGDRLFELGNLFIDQGINVMGTNISSINNTILNTNMYIAKMNDEYKPYKVIDVFSKFEDYKNPKKPLVHPLFNLQYIEGYGFMPVINEINGLHPTDRGYKFIFNLHKDQL